MSEKKLDDRSDAFVSITISENEMEAYASFVPATGKGQALSKAQAESALKANDVTYGIIEENINKAIERSYVEQISIHDVPIALGLKPIKSSPEHINLKPDFFNRSKTVIKKDGSVDYKESSPFVLVKKGEAVGRIFTYRPGKDGYNVLGEAIPFKGKDMQIFKAGENLEIKGDYIYSTAFGRFLIIGDLISVTEVLEIESDVDYHTGNVDFAGEIIIGGEVHDGFRVAAGKSIRIKKIIKNAEVYSRGDLQLDLGVKGRSNALVRVNGMIYAKFIEQATVESRTGISIATSILSSSISTLGKLTMGQKGTIVTSTVIAENGLEVFNLGRENCSPSKVICGLDFVENRKQTNMQNRHEILKEKISKLKAKIEAPEKLINEMNKIVEIQKKEIGEMDAGKYTNLEAKIIVHGTIFAGTEINIGKYNTKIDKDQKAVLIALNKDKLEIEITKIVK